MSSSVSSPSPSSYLLPRSSFPSLIQALKEKGYAVHGPTIHEGTVKWGNIDRIEDLPLGWRDDQQPGQYRLHKTNSIRLFDIVHGPESIKRLTFVPREPLLQIEKKKRGFSVNEVHPQPDRVALLGVRACDLAGLEIHDRIFLDEQFPDPYYQARRQTLLLVAVNCTRAHPTCFCASMGTGPRANAGYDLVLTESDEEFLIQAGSPKGEEILHALPVTVASEARIAQEDRSIRACASSQPQAFDHPVRPEAMYEAHDHPHWEEVAARCLACTNCTMVCPTCFCHTIEETSTLDHETTVRARLWDSCFTSQHGYIHGKNFRPTIKDRYRMWLTHKLGSWIEQFGSSGCVGCGRCITWCPVGIDLREELNALLTTPRT